MRKRKGKMKRERIGFESRWEHFVHLH